MSGFHFSVPRQSYFSINPQKPMTCQFAVDVIATDNVLLNLCAE